MRDLLRLALSLSLCALGGVACDDSTSGSSRIGDDVDDAARADTVSNDAESDPDGDLAREDVLPHVDADANDAANDAAALDALTVVPHPTNPFARYVEWSGRYDSVELQLDCDDGALQARTTVAGDVDPFYLVIGLYDGAACEVTLQAGVAARTARFDVDAGSVPLPSVAIQASDPRAVAPGWTLVGLNNPFDDEPLTLALFDAQGRYRWVHRVASGRPGSDNEVAILDEGILVGGTRREIDPRIVGWDGAERWREPIYMHHDARHLGDRLVYLVHDDVCEWSTKGAGIRERLFETSEVVWSFDLCEHVEPQPGVEDWAHVNTVEPTGDGAYLLSVRNMHHVVRVDRETGAVDWTMGVDGDFELPEGQEWFWRQHAPQQLPDNRVLLFDNGWSETRTWSRAVEYALDPEAGTAEIVWEYRPEPDIFSFIQGDADRLGNGNTLVTFSQRSQSLETRLIEVDAAAEPVWEATIGLPWGIYRSDRVSPPALLHPAE